MKQKVIKPALLLMISIATCYIPMLGYYPITFSWYSAMCTVKLLPLISLPFLINILGTYSGTFVAIKYGTMMMISGMFLTAYRRRANQVNPYVCSVIAAVIACSVEGLDWYIEGMQTIQLYGLVPIIMLVWSTTAIFTYGVQRFMLYIPSLYKKMDLYTREKFQRNERVMRASVAFKKLAGKLQIMSQIEEPIAEGAEGYIEQEIQGKVCAGCENSQIQYIERARLNYLWYNKMLETREAMAIQLNEMADILDYYSGKSTEKHRIFWGIEDYLRRRLRDRKITAKKISVIENEKGRFEVRINAKSKKKTYIKVEVAQRVISEAVGRKMRISNNEIDIIMPVFEEYLFLEEVNFTSISGSACRTRNQGERSGDNFTIMGIPSGQTFMSICDGMGSGKKAWQYSEIVIDLLEQLLESGFTEGSALKLVNSVLLTGNQWQEPAALDMALIDQYSGVCQFLKMGAASTYIKRGNWVECISSTSLPMGVLDEVDVETVCKKLYDGDFVIMMSDGLVDSLDAPDKEQAMGRIIMDINTGSPREMAWNIMDKVLEVCHNVPRDDMTVICTGIWNKI